MNRQGRSVFFLRRLGRGALGLLAAVLPFELVEPLAPLGPLQLSSVEVFLYASVGLWVAARIAALATGGRAFGLPSAWVAWQRLPELHRAAAIWSLVLLVSAAAAPFARPAAFKFALRSLGGVALFVAAGDLLDSRRAVCRTMLGLAAGAAAAAVLMAVEVTGVGLATLLRPFHAQTFGVLGLARASGPFQYPNIAAMYLEAAVPVVLTTGVFVADRVGATRARRILAATALVSLVILYALVLAASRAGLVTALIILLGIAALSGGLPILRRLALVLVGGTLAITIVAQGVSPMLALRLRFWQERPWYGSAIEPSPQPNLALTSPIAPGAEVRVGLSIRNLGAVTWPKAGEKPVRVSYHWTSEDGRTVQVLDGLRTDLPYDVRPDQKIDVLAKVRMPERAGWYLLWWDMVHEGVTWFSDAGDEGRRQRVAVGVSAPRSSHVSPRRAGAKTATAPDVFDQFSRKDLWRAGLLAFLDHPLLGLGPDNFRHAYGRYLGRAETDERLHANNFYIEILSTLGLAGMMAFAGLVAAAVRAAHRVAAAPPVRVLALGVSAALVAYLIHGTLDYFLEFTPTYALLWLLVGLLAALERIAHQDRAARAARAPDVALVADAASSVGASQSAPDIDMDIAPIGANR